MAHRNNGRGDFRIKKSFGTIAAVEVGKLNVPSGTTDKELAERIERALDDVAELGRDGAHLLCDIREYRRTPLEVYRLYQRQQIKSVPVSQAELLIPAWRKFTQTGKRKDGSRISPRTCYDYWCYIGMLTERKIDRISPLEDGEYRWVVGDLPALLQAYRNKHLVKLDTGKLDKADQFRKMKSACQSFARNTQHNGQFSQLWQDITRIDGAPISRGKEDIAIRVFEMRDLIEKLPDQSFRHIAWAMTLTGMQVGEYAGEWSIKGDRVVIHGTKNENRRREVPLLGNFLPQRLSYYVPGVGTSTHNVPGVNVISYKAFNEAVKAASNDRFTAAVFRHSYRLWLREAGVDEWQADKFFGHKTRELKRRYAGHEVDAFLRENTIKLVSYIKREWKKPEVEAEPIERLNLIA